MFGRYYYHETLRKAVTAFGRVFNDIYIAGRNDVRQRVPIVYGQRDKFLLRIREESDLEADQQVAIRLPRMSFEISSIEYASDRQLQRQTRITQSGSTLTRRSRINAAAPYNISFELHVYSKTQDDGLQIVEQILPYFAPQFSLTITPLGGSPDLKEDVPLTLVGVDLADEYEGDFTERRTIVYTLSFELRINFYGPINDGEVIRSVRNEVETSPDEENYRLHVTPRQEFYLQDSPYHTPLFVQDSGDSTNLVLFDSHKVRKLDQFPITDLHGPLADSDVPLIDSDGNLQSVTPSNGYYIELPPERQQITGQGGRYVPVVGGRLAVSIIDDDDEFRFNNEQR